MFFKKKPVSDDALTPEAMVERIETLVALEQALKATARSLLVLLKGSALDIESLKTEEFRQQLDEMGDFISVVDEATVLEKKARTQIRDFEEFAERQAAYLREREAELRNVIKLLSNAISLLSRDNASFHQQILDQGQKFEQISGLDDLRKIKESLTLEVQNLTIMVETKRRAEKTQFDKLGGEVEELREELKKSRSEGRRDALTGVYNRRGLDEYLQELVDENQLRHKPFSAIMLDIDNFKLINDQYGHLVGDQVIAALANACIRALRDRDFVARYGGEEFVAVMPGASRRAASRRAEDLRKTLASTRFSRSSDTEETYLQFTISAGVTEYRAKETAKSLLERADRALYTAKIGGKNRVVSD